MNHVKGVGSGIKIPVIYILTVLTVATLLIVANILTIDVHAQESDYTFWSADHEIYDDNGDCDMSLNTEYEIIDDGTGMSSYDPTILRQWEVGQIGRVSFNTPDFSEENPEDSTVAASDTFAHSGRCALKMVLLNADAGETRSVRIFKRWLDYSNLPNGYYSAWYYAPEVYKTQDFWNIFQFKSQYPNIIDGGLGEGNTSNSMLSFNFESAPIGSDNPTHYNLYVNHKFPQKAHVDSCETTSTDPNKCKNQQYYDQGHQENSGPLEIPAGSWFQIKAYVVQSGSTVTEREGPIATDGTVQNNGVLKVWVTLTDDGVSTEHLIVSKESIPTLMFPEARIKWSVNNYTNYMQDSTIKLYVDDAKISSCDGLYQEAEDAERSGDFRMGRSSGASGGKYLHVPRGEVSEDETTRIAYCFRVDQSGTYRLKGWGAGPDAGSDSFYLAVENDPDTRYYWSVPIGPDFEGGYMQDGFTRSYIDLSLDPGEHRVFLYPREAGARVDRLALEQVDEPIVEDLQEDECGPMGQQAEDGDFSGNFALGEDPNASGGQYIYATSTSQTDGPDPENRARFCFTVPSDGIYYIKGWVYAPNSGANSLYVTVNSVPSTVYTWHTIDFGNEEDISYRGDYVIDNTVDNYVALNLESGPQIVTFYPREAGIRLDLVALIPIGGSLMAAEIAENVSLGFTRKIEQTSSYNLYLPLNINRQGE